MLPYKEKRNRKGENLGQTVLFSFFMEELKCRLDREI